MSQSLIDPNSGLVQSHLDAVRNLITGHLSVMDRNDRVHYAKHCADLIECYKPIGALETQIAQTIAHDYWRLNRVRALEEGIFSVAHPDPSGPVAPHTMEYDIAMSQSRAFLNHQPAFKFLSQYEGRIQRIMNRNKAELRQLQSERRRQPQIGFAFSEQPPASETAETAPPHPPSESPAMSPAEAPKHQTANPNGFGFSTSPAAPKPATSAVSRLIGFAFSTETPSRPNGSGRPRA